jgi:hypothetical protein
MSEPKPEPTSPLESAFKSERQLESNGKQFTTVLRSSDPVAVEAACALLEAEGIATQHVGRNHAALVPSSTFIVVEVRVPE